jgi:hypothetical protein
MSFRSKSLHDRLFLCVLIFTLALLGKAGATCDVANTLTVPGWVALGVDVDGGSVWVRAMPNDGRYNYCVISRFNAATGALEAQSPEFPWNGRGICYANGVLWVTDALADVVHKVDPGTFQEIASFATPAHEPCGITFDGTDLWLTDPSAQRVYRLNVDGTVLGWFAIPDAYRRGLDWHDGLLYLPTGIRSFSSSTTSGVSNEEYDLTCLPADADICDVAIATGGSILYVTNLNRNDGRVYVLNMTPVATEELSWGAVKSLFR